MGMDTYNGPRKRRVAVSEDGQSVNQTLRLTRQAGDMIEALREPGVLFDDGCPMGDVVATALLEFDEAQVREEDRAAGRHAK